jgi:hypothetical protein
MRHTSFSFHVSAALASSAFLAARAGALSPLKRGCGASASAMLLYEIDEEPRVGHGAGSRQACSRLSS